MTIIRNSKECSTVDYFKDNVSNFFEIESEVWGKHINGNKKRIDAVLYPLKNLLSEGFPDIPIGIEMKCNDLEDGNKKQVIEMYGQAITYRHTRFQLKNGFSFIPLILIYPPMSNYLKNNNTDFTSGFQYFAQRLTGLFFIGELFLPRDEPGQLFSIRVCGTNYFVMRNNGKSHRWNSNWGFEVYERELGKLVELKAISPENYEREVLALAHKLGI